MPPYEGGSGGCSRADVKGDRVNEALKEVLDLLDLEQIELDIFRGRSPAERIQRLVHGTSPPAARPA